MLAARQPGAKVRRQRIAEYLFDRSRRLLGRGAVPTASRAAQRDPVGGAITGATKADGIDESFQPVDGMAVDLLPNTREPRRHPAEQVRGQCRTRTQGRIRKRGLYASSRRFRRLHAPADEAITKAQRAGGRSPGEAGHGAIASDDKIFQMLADGLLVPEIVIRRFPSTTCRSRRKPKSARSRWKCRVPAPWSS